MAGTFRNAFPDAFVFGFTGTPIRKKSGGNVRNTFEEFCPPGEIYLDRYTMKDAQDDGFTVPIAYEYNAAIPAVKDRIINEALEHDEETEGDWNSKTVILSILHGIPVKVNLTGWAEFLKGVSYISTGFLLYCNKSAQHTWKVK